MTLTLVLVCNSMHSIYMTEETNKFWSQNILYYLYYMYIFIFNCKKQSYVTFTQWRHQGGTTEIELWIILIQTSSLFLVKTNLTFKDSSVLTILCLNILSQHVVRNLGFFKGHLWLDGWMHSQDITFIHDILSQIGKRNLWQQYKTDWSHFSSFL